MYNLPIVSYKYVTPNTTKNHHGQIINPYDFYHDGSFNKYLQDENEHPVSEDRAYNSFNDYLFDHRTKENSLDRQHIQTFTNSPDKAFKMAKNTIIFTGIISLPQEISDMGGFGDNDTKKKICQFYFNQFMKHHRFDKNDWCYYAAEHTNTTHTHMHIVIYQPDTTLPKRIVDYKIKSNCMTSRWVRTNTIRYTRSIVRTLNDDLVPHLLDAKHSFEREFKIEVHKEDKLDKVKELANVINEVKGIKGKLQYNQLVHYSKLSNDDFEQVKDKEGAISPSESRMLLNKIDALSEFIIKNNGNLNSFMTDINKISDTMYPINTEDNNLNIVNSVDRSYYESELKANLGNIILNEIKSNVSLPIYLMTPEGKKLFAQQVKDLGLDKKKDCRGYKRVVTQGINKAKGDIKSQFNEMIYSSRKSQTEEFSKWLIQIEEEYKKEHELGV